MAELNRNCFVVGIGASAGGLQAVTQLLSRLPKDISMAFVFVQHLDRQHPSELAEILARSCKLPVTWIADHTQVRPAHVYVLPPDREVTIRQHVLTLGQRRAESASSTIDHFLQSLAVDCQESSVAVILSGSGSDGAAGVRAVKEAGGIAFVQEESTAAFSGMGRAARGSGKVDGVLSPEKIADELIKLSKQSFSTATAPSLDRETEALGRDAESLNAVFQVVRARKGVDFGEYKQSTIMRRLLRRMAFKKTDRVPDYLKLLLREREEVEALYESLLINVTTFFRDPEYFEFLQRDIFPSLIAQHTSDRSPLRIWVPGCATGQEAYSLAILLCEAIESSGKAMPVQIFATDLSEIAIEHARNGFYYPTDLAQVSAERTRRFFTNTQRGFLVKKHLRDMCIFARHNVTKDSPFSRLDLISCRNLLIYLGANLQKKLMPIFHYALKPGGHLMLGTSESIGAQVDLFRLVDRRFRIYSRKSSSNRRVNFEFSMKDGPIKPTTVYKPVITLPDETNHPGDILREADRVVLGRHGPPGVLVNEELEILQFRGNVSPYLMPMAGRASLSLLKMAADGLAAELEGAVSEAKNKKLRILRPGVSFTLDHIVRQIDVDVTPLDDGREGERYYLILFVSHANSEPSGHLLKGQRKPIRIGKISHYIAQVEQLKQELQAARNYLQSTIEKHEGTNQELRAANEEIQSSNEELQSTNEELETAKEELQSTNEELSTVNEELHSRQGELIQVNNDLHNLINSVHLPIIILGQDMRIRRFTPMAEQVLNVIPTDIGRPLSDLNINLNVTDLPRLMSEVVESLTIREMEVQDHHGHWFSMRLRPYKTAENRIEGVVMTLIDIDQMKRAMEELEDARLFAMGIGEILPQPVVAVNERLEVQVASQAFHQLFGTTREYVYNRPLLDVAPILREASRFKETLVGALTSGKNVADFPIDVVLPLVGQRQLMVNLRNVVISGQSRRTMLVSFHVVDPSVP